MKWTPELLAEAERNAQQQAAEYDRWERNWQQENTRRRAAEQRQQTETRRS